MMSTTGTIVDYGHYAYRVWALTTRDNPDRYEAWYEIWSPGERAVLLVQTALFGPDQRSVPHAFASAAEARTGAVLEAKWQINHMNRGWMPPDHPARWHRTWRRRTAEAA
jgi:hypothetical protein